MVLAEPQNVEVNRRPVTRPPILGRQRYISRPRPATIRDRLRPVQRPAAVRQPVLGPPAIRQPVAPPRVPAVAAPPVPAAPVAPAPAVPAVAG